MMLAASVDSIPNSNFFLYNYFLSCATLILESLLVVNCKL